MQNGIRLLAAFAVDPGNDGLLNKIHREKDALEDAIIQSATE